MHNLPGTGGFGNLNFPLIQQAIRDAILDEVSAIDEGFVLAGHKNSYNTELAPSQRQGHTSIVARWIAEEMARLNVSGKTFLTLVYDRADRY